MSFRNMKKKGQCFLFVAILAVALILGGCSDGKDTAQRMTSLFYIRMMCIVP